MADVFRAVEEHMSRHLVKPCLVTPI